MNFLKNARRKNIKLCRIGMNLCKCLSKIGISGKFDSSNLVE